MKFLATIKYSKDKETIKAVGPAHHTYLHGLLDSGHLVAAGPFTEDSGALWVYEAETPSQAEKRLQDDPYNAAGVFLNWQIHPLAYWSAKEQKGK